eukprot:3157512-Amphidinium_carterae.2
MPRDFKGSVGLLSWIVRGHCDTEQQGALTSTVRVSYCTARMRCARASRRKATAAVLHRTCTC